MDFSFGFGLGSRVYFNWVNNPNIVYIWVVYNDNNTILFNDGNSLGYRE